MSGVPLAFQPERPAGVELKRLAIALADDALRHLLSAQRGSREEAVHEARKRFKELRALLRLAGGGASASRARSVRRLIRDAGRALSAARDADIVSETFEKLQARYGSRLDATRSLRAKMMAAAALAAPETTSAVQLVGRARNDIALWVPELSDDGVIDAVRRSYRAARAAMREALAVRSDAAFHEWRKREKDHWYHARFTAATLPAMHRREPQLHRLSRILGDHHDLVIVRETAARIATAAEAAELIDLSLLIAERMRELERDAVAAGSEAFASKVSGFRAELSDSRTVLARRMPLALTDFPGNESDERTVV